MSNEVIQVDGEERVVREDTAKAFRWRRFAVILLVGIAVIMLVAVLFFSGVLTAVDPPVTPSNAANPANAGP